MKETKARQGRNPRTGEPIAIAARRNASFRAAGDLKEKLSKAAETVTG
jgi:nucleoid DNA-binding protein